MMKSFRNDIITQVNSIPEGKIFTFKDLVFAPSKRANVAVALSDMTKKGLIVRVEKGVFYRPKPSLLGLGPLPLYNEDKIDYLLNKYSGYLTGTRIFNQMKLTEQVSMVVCLATEKPVKNFIFDGMRVKCVKSYVTPDKYNMIYIYVLDAIKEMKQIPGTTPQDVYNRLIHLYLSEYSKADLDSIVEISLNYPPRVRKTLADMLENINCLEHSSFLNRTLDKLYKLNVNYKRYNYESSQR